LSFGLIYTASINIKAKGSVDRDSIVFNQLVQTWKKIVLAQSGDGTGGHGGSVFENLKRFGRPSVTECRQKHNVASHSAYVIFSYIARRRKRICELDICCVNAGGDTGSNTDDKCGNREGWCGYGTDCQ
jgi:hypothetical protein